MPVTNNQLWSIAGKREGAAIARPCDDERQRQFTDSQPGPGRESSEETGGLADKGLLTQERHPSSGIRRFITVPGDFDTDRALSNMSPGNTEYRGTTRRGRTFGAAHIPHIRCWMLSSLVSWVLGGISVLRWAVRGCADSGDVNE